MAGSVTVPEAPAAIRSAADRRALAFSTWRKAVEPLASLKLTVALFAMAIVIVLAGTFAQAQMGIWQAVHKYFRSAFVWIEFEIFFPQAFFPDRQWHVPGGFPFLGGWAIGGLMALNLLAAHGLRFTVQARGTRLLLGLGTVALGALVTWLVVVSGSNKAGLQGQPLLAWDTLWWLFKLGTTALAVVTAAALLLRVPAERQAERRVLWATAGVLTALSVFLWLLGDRRLDDSAMRILWQLIKGFFAGGVLLAGCVLLFRQRAGVVLLHAGIGLMMVSEIIAGTLVEEAQMRIAEGEAVNFVEDIRSYELALVDTTDPEQKVAVVVPASRLADAVGQTIRDENLPFDLRVVDYAANSDLRERKRSESAPADRGAGLHWTIEKLPPVSGTDQSNRVDAPSAYVEFLDKQSGESLGTYLVSLHLMEQPLDVDGRHFEVALRFKRTYKPYTVRLIDVRKDTYIGTNMPRNYSSDIHLVDPTRNENRKVHIWMNNPLRYAGETFYQSDYRGPPEVPVETTVLSVVNNTGWMIPYVACMIVATGMLTHFSGVLVRYLNRRQRGVVAVASSDILPGEPPQHEDAAANDSHRTQHSSSERPVRTVHPSPSDAGNWYSLRQWLIPLGVISLCVGWVVSKAVPPSAATAKVDFYTLGKLPVVYEGRTKPLDTLARTSLRILSDRQSAAVPMTRAQLEENWDKVRKALLKQFKALDEGDLDGFEGDVDQLIELISRETGRKPERVRPEVETIASVKQSAIQWLMDLITHPDRTDRYRVFRIEHPEVLETLKLKRRQGLRYALAEFESQLDEFRKQVKQAESVPRERLSLYQRKILDLDRKLQLHAMLRESFRLPPDERADVWDQVVHLMGVGEVASKLKRVPLAVPQRDEDQPWEALTVAAARAWIQEMAQDRQVRTIRALAEGLADDLAETDRFEQLVDDHIDSQVREDVMRLVAEMVRRANPDLPDDRLHALIRDRIEKLPQNLRTSLEAASRADQERRRPEIRAELIRRTAASLSRSIVAVLGEQDIVDPPNEAALAWTRILRAYRRGEVETLQSEVAACREVLASMQPPQLDSAKVDFEAYFNHVEPFYVASVLYVLVFVLAAGSWLGWSQSLNRTALLLAVFTFVVHSLALAGRIYISGRPPVTNLYSSAVFIGWGAGLLGIVYECLNRLSIGNVVAGLSGFATLLIAHFLSLDGDTITRLQAVLDTTFWLATHVVCITLGYATTLVAGLLGVLYVVRGALTPSLDRDSARELARMIYGTLCFAIFFSFVGTVLGGLWADDSWGRFWGWDPKENGALLIVLWNALVLHARWDGMVKQRGLAVLAIAGNVVTAWSWFGTNELGIGLHSYGFTEGVLQALGLFVASQLVLVGIGLLPTDFWWSWRREKAAA